MSQWHKDWQNMFETTEVTVDCHGRNRRADVMIADLCVEFQHSRITSEEVCARNQDWSSVGKKVIWVVDGTGESFLNMSNDRVFVDFVSTWKYESFLTCDRVFIHNGDYVYELIPKYVKSQITELFVIPMNEFIHQLKSGVLEFPTREHVCTKVFVKQQGAGNGKTFGIVQLIQNPEFEHVNTFIYLTKQHSAKTVIKSEIEDQRKRGYLHVSDLSDAILSNKKYIITFRHNETDKKIIIGTFDSFIYALGNKNIKCLDMFKSMVRGIIDDELRCTKNGSVSYTTRVRLNKRLLLVGDEMQDLDDTYAKALLKISREKYVDFYAVGDLLQSISLRHNAMTYLSTYEFDESIFAMERITPVNENRRIAPASRYSMIPFINQMVPFEKFNLPPIESGNNNPVSVDSAVSFIHGEEAYQDECKINQEVDKLMTHYAYEVNHHDRKPNDFLIVSSFVKKNPLMEAFHTAIREFWEHRERTHKYINWSVFHKSEEGTSIDLEESKDATRIVSIHSSKGDGRPVVFVLDMIESVFVNYSNIPNNLVYESLLHVAITRAKEKMYIYYIPEKRCDISRRFAGYDKTYTPGAYSFQSIPRRVDLKQLIQDKEHVYDRLQPLLAFPDLGETNTHDNCIIDMKHHILRGITQYNITLLCILDLFGKSNDHQITKVIADIRKYDIVECESAAYFKRIQMKNNKTIMHETHTIPIMRYKSFGGDYQEYLDRIMCSVRRIQKIPMHKLIHKLGTIDLLVLGHLIQLYLQGHFTIFPIADLYDMIHLFSDATPDEKEEYKRIHHKKLNGIHRRVSILHAEYPRMKFAIENPVMYHNGCGDFDLYHVFPMIGRDEHTVLLCVIQPQINALNLNQTVLNAAFYTHLARNSTKSAEGIHRFDFKDKRIRVCVLAFEHDPVYIDMSDEHEDLFRETLREELREYMKRYHECVYNSVCRITRPQKELRTVIEKMKHDNNYVKRYLTALEDQMQNDDSPETFWNDVVSDKDKFILQLDKRLERTLDSFSCQTLL